MTVSRPPLCIADDATFWPWLRWPDFSRWKNAVDTIVVIPIAGFADWGLGHALDAEETLLLNVLREASQQKPVDLSLLVVPPLRFVLGPDPDSAFPVAPPVAHELIAEVAASIAFAGFRRVVLFNASPWNEELIAAAARDLRIAHGLQMFRISLSGLGLDLHPTRSRDRRKVQTLLTALTGHAPESTMEHSSETGTRPWGDETVDWLPDPPLSLADAMAAGPGFLADASARLLSLLGEISHRPPLANHGAIPVARP